METKVLILVQLVVVAYANNIDILQPILRTSPDTFQNGSLFGYSLSLHQVAPVPGSNFQMAMTNTRIVVSAPKRTTVGGQVANTGAVYVCPVAPGPCVHSTHSRLYDTQGNAVPEDKANQFLGASMASDGENLVVCAHRYNFVDNSVRNQNSLRYRPITGRCFASTNRDLSAFTDIQPCREPDSGSVFSAELCQVGVSSVVLPGPVYGLGAPGYYRGRGNLISVTTNDAANNAVNSPRLGSGQGVPNEFGYLGYGTTAGYFSVIDRLDYAVSVPRFSLYTGAVHIILRANGLTLVSQPALRGTQMGEGYGFSVLAANLAGNGLSELLVGSPYFSTGGTMSDVGRVFVYSNTGGSLSQQRVIVGTQADARFGYAMANMGDINGDGYDDIAISAPFSSTGESGTVYLYYGSNSQGLSLNPQQTIVGSSLSLSGVSPFTGFGTALASGIDVDGNSFNDLAIGSFESQKVFLLRTRPVAKTATSFRAIPPIVDLESFPCNFQNQYYACFMVEVCTQYSGSGLSNQLLYEFNLTADTRSMENRIIFESNMPTILANVTITANNKICQNFTAYILNNTQDRFNPYFVNFSLRVPQPAINQGDGNLALQDFSGYPVLQLSGSSEIQVESLKDCNGAVCIPDLRVQVLSTSTIQTDGTIRENNTIVVGGVRSTQIRLEVVNVGEDAFQASVTITIPFQLEFGKVTGAFNNTGAVTLTCGSASRDETAMTSSTTCNIGNPFRGPNNNVDMNITLIPQKDLRGNEGDLTITFSTTSLNPENAATVNDGSNMASTILRTAAEADISIDSPGIVSPEQLAYSRTPPNSSSITSVTQLGPRFSVSFVVRNAGPSTVRNIRLVIYWPLSGSTTGNFYYLYPARFSTSETGATITCNNENIHPDRTLTLSDNNDESAENTGTSTIGKKRRKRSASSNHNIHKRQNIAMPGDSGTDNTELFTINQTISCANGGAVLNCVPIECTIISLQGSTNSRARVNIIGYIDQRFFSTGVDRYSIMPNATINIVGDEFVRERNPTTGKTATATVRLIPAEVAIVGESRAIPWWVFVLAIAAALIIIILIAIILWALGFFKLKKRDDIKQKRKELEELEEHGMSAGIGGGSTENMIAS